MKHRALLGGLVSAALIYVLFRSLDPSAVAQGLFQNDPLWLIPALALYFCGVWLRSVRWRYLLQPLKPLPTYALFRAMIIGFTVNNLMPVRLGEVVRAVLLARSHGVPASSTLGTILVEHFFDGLTLCAFLALGLRLLPQAANDAAWLVLLAQLSGGAFVFAVAVAWLLAARPGFVLGLAKRLLSPAPPALRERVMGLLEGFMRGLRSLSQSHLVLPVALLSLAAWTLEASMYYVIMHGFKLGVGPIAAFLGTAAANLGTMIPSSPGYVGTFDVPLQAVLTTGFGIAPALAMSYTLVVHAALIVPVVALGLIFLAGTDLSLRQLTRPGTLARLARAPRVVLSERDGTDSTVRHSSSKI